MSLDMRHSDIECTLRGKNRAESVNAAAVASHVVRVEQHSRRPTDHVTATKEPTTVRNRKVGVTTAPGLIEARD